MIVGKWIWNRPGSGWSQPIAVVHTDTCKFKMSAVAAANKFGDEFVFETTHPSNQFVASLKAEKGDEHKIASIVNLAYSRGEKGMWKSHAKRTNPEEIKKHCCDHNIIIVRAADERVMGNEQRIVGTVYVTNNFCGDAEVGELGMLAVHEDYLGRGIGTLLIQCAEEYCRRSKCKTIRLELLTPKSYVHLFKKRLDEWYRKMQYVKGLTEDFNKAYPHIVPMLSCECDFTVYTKILPANQSSPIEFLGSSENTVDSDSSNFQDINSASSIDPEEYYDQMASEYNDIVVRKWGYKMPVEVVRRVLEAKISCASRILDLGGGNGLVGLGLCKSGYGDISGVDISDKMIEMAQETNAYKQILKFDLSKKLPLAADSQDVLVCVGTTTYLDPSVIHDWCRIVKTGGYIIFTHKTAVWKIWEPTQEQLLNDRKIEKVSISEDLPYLPGFSEDARLHERARIYIYKVL